jgi:hypothetical protein
MEMKNMLSNEDAGPRIESRPRYWLTPPDIYHGLDQEFKFDFNPCPYPYEKDGIEAPWGNSNYINPPFCKADIKNGHGPGAFVRKAIEEQKNGKTSVLIMPVPLYVHLLLKAHAELRPLGRVQWLEVESKKPMTKHMNPSPCAIFILKGDEKNCLI